MKAIINELIKIQRGFLWGGVEKNKKIDWISWEKIYLSKKKGGLSIKHSGNFNLALFYKWKWIILKDVKTPWFKLLSCRYDNIKRIILSDPCPLLGSKVSVWLKDICAMGSSSEHSNWFIEYIAYKTGNDDFIDFWCDRWLDPVPLCGIFLFSISVGIFGQV